MATLTQIRQGLGQVWDSVVEGWRTLTRRASSAITRFSLPGKAARDSDEMALVEAGRRSVGWGVLAAEVFDDSDRVVVRVEAPGMKRSDFDIEVLDDILLIRGEKKIERESTVGQYHLVECAYGSFERAIPLPVPVKPAKAKARYRKGVLRIELPKRKESRPRVRQIPIR
ncbi:Hsp20/alpha crystallin family protein [Desulfolithobacter sp.]